MIVTRRKISLLSVAAALTALLFAPVAPFARAQTAAPVAQTRRADVSPSVLRADCFPIERLPDPLRAEAERMLLKLLDSEALYTVIGDIKPMSSGYASYRLDTKNPNTVKLEEARQIVGAFRCGDALFANILPFHRVDEKGSRYFEAVIFSQAAHERMTREYASFFAPYGVTARTPPMDTALVVEHDPTTARNRGLGYLYGYPKHAVDFFVASADEQGETKQFVKRDFLHIATFARPTNQFVYAVPQGYTPALIDIELREKAERILAAYRARRARYIGPGRPGVAALLRDWMDDGRGRCAPENATF